jgi:hypothetical protein
MVSHSAEHSQQFIQVINTVLIIIVNVLLKKRRGIRGCLDINRIGIGRTVQIIESTLIG